MIQPAHVILPHGLWLENRRLTEAGLHPLSGHDEAYLLAQRASLAPARWTSEVLARTLAYIEDIVPVPLSYVQAMTVGDREALLLHLRRLTFGERLSCVLHCPQCSIKLDVDLEVGQLLLPPYAAPGYWYRMLLPGSDMTVTFRLPTGVDQEAVAEHISRSGGTNMGAAALLAARCLHEVTQAGNVLESLPDEWIPSLGEAMSERDPQAELVLNNVCPECENSFGVLLDMAQFLAEEINQRIRYLYREVHTLAWYYHWSEADIMRMTRPHRQIYLELLDEAVGEVRA